jgi:hypothetical protein
MRGTLSDARKKSRVEFSRDFLQLLEDHRELQFDGVTTEDQSWFRYLIQSESMLASSRYVAIPRLRPDMSAKTTILMVFFTSRMLLILDALAKGQKYNPDYFAQNVISELQSESSRFGRRKTVAEFAAHMPNSMCPNGTKVRRTLDKADVIRALARSIHQT